MWEWLEWDHNLSSYDLKGHLKSNDTSLDVVNDDPDLSKIQEVDDSYEIDFNSILVVTAETMKQKFYIETMIRLGNSVLLLGDTGTGKT